MLASSHTLSCSRANILFHSFIYVCIYLVFFEFIYYITHIYNTLRSQLVRPKEKTTPEKKMGVVYDITCNSCGEHYIRWTARALEKRLGERQKKTGSLGTPVQSQPWDQLGGCQDPWPGDSLRNKRFCLVSERWRKDRRTGFSVLAAREMEPFFPSPSPLFYSRHFRAVFWLSFLVL